MPVGMMQQKGFLCLAGQASSKDEFEHYMKRAGIPVTFARLRFLYHMSDVSLDVIEESAGCVAFTWACKHQLFDDLNWQITKLGHWLLCLGLKWYDEDSLRAIPLAFQYAQHSVERPEGYLDPEIRLIQDSWNDRTKADRLAESYQTVVWEVPLIHLDSDLEVALQHPPALGSLRAQVRRAKIRRNNCGTYRWFPLIEETDDWFDDVIKNVENSLERACGLDD